MDGAAHAAGVDLGRQAARAYIRGDRKTLDLPHMRHWPQDAVDHPCSWAQGWIDGLEIEGIDDTTRPQEGN